MQTNASQLETILARFPKNRAKDIQAAYQLGHDNGLNQLDAKLAATATPALNSPAALPAIPKTVLYAALFSKLLDTHLHEARLDARREEKMRLGQMQQQNGANLGYLRGLLDRYLRIVDSQGELTNRQSTDSYLDNFATLLWEGVDAVLGSDDPVKAVSLLRMLQEEGTNAIVLSEDVEPQMQAA